MPRPFVLVATGAAVGCALIYLFYSAVRTRWPSNYASSSNDFGMIVNRTLIRYTAFACGPPYVVSLLVSTTINRAGGPGMIAAILIGAFHVGYLRVPETYRALRYNHSAMRRPTVVMEIALALGGLGVSVLGGLGAGRFGFVVPPIDELFKSLWGTTFVAIVAAIVIAKTRVQLDLGRLVNRSRKEVGSRLRELARSEAVKSGTDPDLVESVLLAENLERPRWFRQLERAKGRLFPHGSYGVMQVTSESPIDDEVSIVRAVGEHLQGATLQRRNDGYVDYQSVEAALRQYNNDPVFVGLATQIFWTIWTPSNIKNEPVPPEVPSADVKAIEPEPELNERMELLARNARLCIVAAATLSTATIDELRILNDSLAAFIGNQAQRPGGQSPVFPLALIVPSQAMEPEGGAPKPE